MLMSLHREIIENLWLEELHKEELDKEISTIKIETMLDAQESILYFTAHLLYKETYTFQSHKFRIDFIQKKLTLLS